MLAAWRELIAPGKLGAVEPTSRGKFPFGFGWQILASPFGVGHGVGERHVNDGMSIEPIDIAVRPVRMTPIRGLHKCPPFAPVFQIDKVIGSREDERAGIEHVWQRTRIVLRVWRNLGKRDVSRCLHKFFELPVRYGRAVHPELIHGDPVDRGLFRIMLVRAHAEGTTANAHHVRYLLMGMRLGFVAYFHMRAVARHQLLRSHCFPGISRSTTQLRQLCNFGKLQICIWGSYAVVW